MIPDLTYNLVTIIQILFIVIITAIIVFLALRTKLTHVDKFRKNFIFGVSVILILAIVFNTYQFLFYVNLETSVSLVLMMSFAGLLASNILIIFAIFVNLN